MILIFTVKTAPRLSYISRYLFTSILGVRVELTTNQQKFEQYQGPKINYTKKWYDGITIFPHSLLFEQDIQTFSIKASKYQSIPVLFRHEQQSSLPFDPFAAAFFMISRYEEYWTQPLDKFGRVSAKNSMAYQNGFLEIPVVDHWALILRQSIEAHYPNYQFPKRTYRYMSTIDIDIAFAYRYRSLWRTVAATAKSLLYQRFDDVRKRFGVLFNNDHDPYDVFSWLQNFNAQYYISPVFFFLVGKYGSHDKNISPRKSAMKKLIQQTDRDFNIGVHPSYQSNENIELLKSEIDRLKNITGKSITRSRQHFLKLRFPETYRRLISFGITEDFTMGYATLPGFRAGTCTPFPFYDLTTEEETKLIIHPFQVMDGTLNQYMRLSPLEAIDKISAINAEVRKVDGTFVSLWHNESLSEMREWHGWQDVFIALTKIAVDS